MTKTTDYSRLSEQELLERRADTYAEMKTLADEGKREGGHFTARDDEDWRKLDGIYNDLNDELSQRRRARMDAITENETRPTGRRIPPDPIGQPWRGGNDPWTAVRSNSGPVNHRAIDRALEAASERWDARTFNRGFGSGVVYESGGVECRGLKPGESMYMAATGRDLPAPEERFSLGRWLRGYISRDWRHAALEQRVHQSLQVTTGGIALAGSVASFILDVPRKLSTYGQLAQTLMMGSQEIMIPRQTSDLSAAFRPEGGSINVSDSAFGGLKMVARPVSCLCRVTRELVKDAPMVARQLEISGSKAIALEIDRCAYNGIGVGGGEPAGAFLDSEITTSDLGGVALSFDDLVSMWGDVAGANFTPNAWVWPTSVAEQFGKRKSGAGEYVMGDDYPELLKPLQRLHTTQLGDDVLMGDWSEAIFAIRDELEVDVLNAGTAGGIDAVPTNSLWIRFVMRVDVGLTRGAAFSARTSVSTA